MSKEGFPIESMKKTALYLMIITVVSKITGFLRDVILSFFYGATAVSDAYIISITITSVLFSLIIAGISTAFIPMYKQIEVESGINAANRFTNNLVNIVLIITTLVVILGVAFSPLLVKIFAVGFSGENLEKTVYFTKISLIGIYFTSLTQLFTGYLQLNGKFIIPAMIGLPFNIIVIITIYISDATSSIFYLAFGNVIAALVQMLFLFPSLWRTRYRYSFYVKLKDKHLKKMSQIVFPIMIGISIDQINLMIDKTLASTIEEGGISALTYASRLNDFVQGIFVLSFVTVMFPYISKMVAQHNTEELKKSINEVISSVIIIVVPASVGIMILAEPIVKLLFGHGHFDKHAIEMTTKALFYYSIGMIGYGIREVLNRTFYSLQDSKTPMFNAGIAVLINIALNILLSRFMGLSGLALATSISALLCSFLLAVHLQKKIGPFGLVKILITLLKVCLASAGMGIIIYLLNLHLEDWNILFKMIFIVCMGAIVYFLIITLLKIKEAKILASYITNAIQRKL